MGARPIGGREPSLRDAVIAMYERRLPKAVLDPPSVGGIMSREHIHRQLEQLRAGQNVQLHRWPELSSLPTAHRPTDRSHALYELRGDELVPVPTWQPGCPPPYQWTVPVTVAGRTG